MFTLSELASRKPTDLFLCRSHTSTAASSRGCLDCVFARVPRSQPHHYAAVVAFAYTALRPMSLLHRQVTPVQRIFLSLLNVYRTVRVLNAQHIPSVNHLCVLWAGGLCRTHCLHFEKTSEPAPNLHALFSPAIISLQISELPHAQATGNSYSLSTNPVWKGRKSSETVGRSMCAGTKLRQPMRKINLTIIIISIG